MLENVPVTIPLVLKIIVITNLMKCVFLKLFFV